MDTFQFFADRGDARLRLDRILLRRVTMVSRLSRTLTQEWIEAGAVTVDDVVRRRPAARVREGASVRVRLPAGTSLREEPKAEPIALTALYDDDSMLVIDKPAGMVVHPSYKQVAGTLLNAVLWRVRERQDLQPAVVTRLDKGTSGLVLVALTPGVHASLQRLSAAGTVVKEYLAVVRGTPAPRDGCIRGGLDRDPHDRRRMIVTLSGAHSETRYEVLSTRETAAGPESLVRCRLVTGRTHQIRVHLASIGTPIVGDVTYGTPDDRITRQALHAWRLTLPHPVAGNMLTFTAPPPPDIERLLED